MSRLLPSRLAPAAALLLLPASVLAAGEREAPYRVLFLTHSATFEHPVVKRAEEGGLSIAELGIQRAGGERFEFTCTKDCDALADLAGYDAVMLYTTGELPVDPAVRAALFDWVAEGGALVGVHCATDTWYESPVYGELIGGRFDGHPWHQEVRVRVEDPRHPAVAHLGDSFVVTDEIYQFRDFRRHPLNVLLSLDTSSVDVTKGKREDGDYALAWWRDWGRGRVFYTALGHRAELWGDERFTRHVLEGIAWAVDGPDVPAPVPAGLEGQVAGGPAGHFLGRDGGAFPWRVEGEAIEVVPGAGDVTTAVTYRDALLHVEFRLPDPPGEGRGNSGVYVHGRYELQVLDSLGHDTDAHECAAIYDQKAPDRNVSRAPGAWQSYDVRFRAPRFGDGGAKTENARISVWHNGYLVHDDVELPEPTPGGLTTRALRTGGSVEAPETDFAPLLLQDHGERVQYRNVWVRLL